MCMYASLQSNPFGTFPCMEGLREGWCESSGPFCHGYRPSLIKFRFFCFAWEVGVHRINFFNSLLHPLRVENPYFGLKISILPVKRINPEEGKLRAGTLGSWSKEKITETAGTGLIITGSKTTKNIINNVLCVNIFTFKIRTGDSSYFCTIAIHFDSLLI